MRQIAFAALVLAALGVRLSLTPHRRNSDIVEQNGVLIFYPPGTAEAAAAVADATHPTVINKAIAVQNVVVQVRRGWARVGVPGRPTPASAREYSGRVTRSEARFLTQNGVVRAHPRGYKPRAGRRSPLEEGPART